MSSVDSINSSPMDGSPNNAQCSMNNAKIDLDWSTPCANSMLKPNLEKRHKILLAKERSVLKKLDGAYNALNHIQLKRTQEVNGNESMRIDHLNNQIESLKEKLDEIHQKKDLYR